MSSWIEVMRQAMLRAVPGVEPEFVSFPERGSSGAYVSILRAGGALYAVKCCTQARVPFALQAERQESLRPYIGAHLCRTVFTGQVEGFEVMVSECPSTATLHSLILQGDQPESSLLAVWADFIGGLERLWRDSRESPRRAELCPRDHQARCDRVQRYVQGVEIEGRPLAELQDLPLVINGNRLPPLRQLLPTLRDLPEPEYGVLCHGDPNPSNVLVSREGGWHLVDWEWSGPHHDWRMMMSHLVGWWMTRCTRLLAPPRASLVGGRLCLDYELRLDARYDAFQAAALAAFRRISGARGASDDLRAFHLYLSTLLLAEGRFLGPGNRQDFALPLMGEGLMLLASCMRMATVLPLRLIRPAAGDASGRARAIAM